MLKSTSTTQAVIALSSGESEFYGAVKATAAGLGLVSMMKDLGVTLPGSERNTTSSSGKRIPCIEVRMDASAGRGICMRRGAGRIRHIATPTLWIQKHVQDGTVATKKVPGKDNFADLGTKHLDNKTLIDLTTRCGFVFMEGKNSLASKLAGSERIRKVVCRKRA